MKIKAHVVVGLEFGTEGKPVVEVKTFDSIVDFNSFMNLQRDFDAEDEVVKVEWEC